MKRRHHYRRLQQEPAELNMTTFLNLMVALIPFLLVTAVFSRITVVELDLPSAASSSVSAPVFRLEVIVRDEGFELTNGSALIAAIPKREGEYDLETLARLALSLKRDHPDADDASVLLEPEIAYDHLIQVMDVIRTAELPAADAAAAGSAAAATAPQREPEPREAATDAPAATEPKPVRVALFTDIAVGDAP
jgi:biopolymer transport protein ExbD